MTVERQKGKVSVVVSFAVAYKLNTLIITVMLLGMYPNELKTYPPRILHLDVYSSFISNFQNWEVTNMPFSR